MHVTAAVVRPRSVDHGQSCRALRQLALCQTGRVSIPAFSHECCQLNQLQTDLYVSGLVTAGRCELWMCQLQIDL